MPAFQVGDTLKLDDTRKTDRGPVVKVRAVIAGGDRNTGSYGLSIKGLKARKNGEEFDCYLADFSDSTTDTVTRKDKFGNDIQVKYKGWMDFVNPEDRKRWQEWMAKAQKAQAK